MPTSKIKDLTGQRFGRLLIIGYSHSNFDYVPYWKCLCDCGNYFITSSKLLKIINKSIRSCGCYKRESISKRMSTHGFSTNGQELPLEYNSWKQMKSRCYNTKSNCYKNYGGRGINVCDRWLGIDGFSNFIKDMGKRPTEKHSLDRFPDKDGNYTRENCRWATRKEQSSNIRSNVWIEYNGERKILSEWARILDCNFMSIKFHLKKGKSFEYIFDWFNNKKKQAKAY